MSAHRGFPEEGPWLPRALLHGRMFLLFAFIVTVGLTLLAASNPDWLAHLDEPISEWIRGSGGAEPVVRVVTQLGSPNLSVFIGVVGGALLWRRCRASSLALLALVSMGVASDLLLKLIVDRPRPTGAVIGTSLGSFPSGHAIHAVIILGIVPFLLWAHTGNKAFLRVGAVMFAVGVPAVALSRVRLGAHWPSDVVASFFIGVTLLVATEQLLTSAWAARRCELLGLHQGVSASHRDT